MALTPTFPGVYIRVFDDSFFPTIRSRFRPGLIGVAEKGPFDVPVSIRSVKDFAAVFGRSLSGSFLADATGIVSSLSDGATVVRIGRRYESSAFANASGTEGTYTVYTPQAQLFQPGDYIRITETGKSTTVNARVEDVFINDGYFTLSQAPLEIVPLADNYVSATVDRAPVPNAANEAESFLYSPTWTAPLTDSLGAPLAINGDKNAYLFTMSVTDGSTIPIAAGDSLLIEEPNRNSTREARVKRVELTTLSPRKYTIYLETANRADIGYQQISLQDNYQSGGATPNTVRKMVLSAPNTPVLIKTAQILAATAGTWANQEGRNGLFVRVGVGSRPDTKKILVYYDQALAETIDNLQFNPVLPGTLADPNPNYVMTRINGQSAFITVNLLVDNEPFLNTQEGWNTTIAPHINVASFRGGFNGEYASAADYIGTISPYDDSVSGLRVFEDTDNLDINLIASPGFITYGDSVDDATVTDFTVVMEMLRIAKRINAFSIIDVPDSLTAREAIDWHNGAGLFSNSVRIDNPYVACYWNWWEGQDVFTGAFKMMPPTIGTLRCMAFTFDTFKPWYAAAGEVRGLIPEAVRVEFERLSQDTKDAMYGNGQSVNPILLNRGRIMLFGERTMQRRESKLTAVHSVILVNYTVRGLAEIGRRYIFDPNDEILLSQLRGAFAAFLDGIKKERGIEGYNLVIDDSNNTPETRNRREVIADLYIIPTDTMERLFINATVRESGASLNAVR